MSVSIRRYDLLQPRFSRFTRTLQRVDQLDPLASHAARVAARRLREVLPVLQLEATASEKIEKRLRKMARRLGDVRELDVLLELLDGITDPSRDIRHAVTRVKNEFRHQRDRSRIRSQWKKASADGWRAAHRLQEVLDRLKDSDERPADARAVRWAVKARVARRAATLAQAIEDAGHLYLAERLHELRLAVKKLRYGAELAFDAAGNVSPADLRALEQAQDLLGRLHDWQTLVDRIRALQGSLMPSGAKGWDETGALVLPIERRCRRLHARYVRDREALLQACERLAGRPNTVIKRKVS